MESAYSIFSISSEFSYFQVFDFQIFRFSDFRFPDFLIFRFLILQFGRIFCFLEQCCKYRLRNPQTKHNHHNKCFLILFKMIFPNFLENIFGVVMRDFIYLFFGGEFFIFRFSIFRYSDFRDFQIFGFWIFVFFNSRFSDFQARAIARSSHKDHNNRKQSANYAPTINNYAPTINTYALTINNYTSIIHSLYIHYTELGYPCTHDCANVTRHCV